MLDIKSLFKQEVEKELSDVDDFIFIPERIELNIDGGDLICVLNTDGSVDIFYIKQGVTEARVAARKHPLTAFETELHHGIYDDVIEDLIKSVNETLEGKSKYFVDIVLPSTASLNAPQPESITPSNTLD
ncbi:hypothetical protein [Psychrobacter sp. FDAARGOS_221]|uniref:hypothetical protein n=1 Tax=Psychrobacter sp. FDAARGOS_221 TaxID=1975705 RepID=UPI000BB574B0|nr:hypothetical protein [Psychrobacter sp. FDAARGOS_221]PNK60854.1 hypothetical protein A6J60_008160 [Psychrobacter sp. FDAARGOS_221]